jgi:2-oxoisovalerate dehydrogenase E1 component beta subunit
VTPWAKHPAAEVPDGHYTVPLGKAAVARAGEQVTIIAYGTMVTSRSPPPRRRGSTPR